MDGVLHNRFTFDKNNSSYSIIIADGTHELQRLLMYLEDVLADVLGDLIIYVVMFHLSLLPSNENLITSPELVVGTEYDAMSNTCKNVLNDFREFLYVMSWRNL